MSSWLTELLCQCTGQTPSSLSPSPSHVCLQPWVFTILKAHFLTPSSFLMHRHSLYNAWYLLGSLLLRCHHLKMHPLFSMQATSLACLVILPQLLLTAKIPPSSARNLSLQVFTAILTSDPYLGSILNTPKSLQVLFLEALPSIPEAVPTHSFP